MYPNASSNISIIIAMNGYVCGYKSAHAQIWVEICEQILQTAYKKTERYFLCLYIGWIVKCNCRWLNGWRMNGYKSQLMKTQTAALDEARRFYALYSRDDPAMITDVFLMGKLIHTDDQQYPLYLPHMRRTGMVHLHMKDIPQPARISRNWIKNKSTGKGVLNVWRDG